MGAGLFDGDWSFCVGVGMVENVISAIIEDIKRDLQSRSAVFHRKAHLNSDRSSDVECRCRFPSVIPEGKGLKVSLPSTRHKTDFGCLGSFLSQISARNALRRPSSYEVSMIK